MYDLFGRLQVEGEAGIRRLVDERAQENVTLDFKRKRDATKGAFDKDDRAILAEILSGFANSAGGLAIWGVDARKNEDGVDCAKDRVPITGIERLQSEAQTLVGQLVLPRLEGVHLAHIKCDADPTTGYLLVHVERSERRPHRSEAAGQKQYYKRAGDSFFAMEHYDIEDAFKRVYSPKLNIGLNISYKGAVREPEVLRRIFQITILLHNVGSALAKYPYIQIGKQAGALIENVDHGGGLKLAGTVNGWTTYAGGSDQVIHPGQILPALSLRVDHGTHRGELVSLGCPPGGMPRLGLHCRGGCENSASIKVDFWKEGSEALALLHSAMSEQVVFETVSTP